MDMETILYIKFFIIFFLLCVSGVLVVYSLKIFDDDKYIGTALRGVALTVCILSCVASLFFWYKIICLLLFCENFDRNSNTAVATSETAMCEDQENNTVEIDGKTYILVDGSAYKLQQ